MNKKKRIVLVVVIVVAASIAGATVYFVPQSEIVLLSLIVLGLIINNMRMRRLDYARGWLDRSQVFYGSLNEAMHRGMDVDDWLVAEGERDVRFFTENVLTKRQRRNPKYTINILVTRGDDGPESSCGNEPT
jgi:hypothetical protein